MGKNVFVIRKEGDGFVLYDHTGSKVLGRHKTKEDALAQERAIEAHKHDHAGDMEGLAPPPAPKLTDIAPPAAGSMCEACKAMAGGDPVTDDSQTHAKTTCGCQKMDEDDPDEDASMMAEDTSFEAEVFSAGQWGGLDWSTDDLDQMVTNFSVLKESIKPPLKLGHDDNQILAQRDGQPALGWVTGLRRQGNKLVARFEHVPTQLFGLIQKRRYARVSAEIYPRFEMTSAAKSLNSPVQGRVLLAVSLLGAEVPEVKNLADLARILNAENRGSVSFSFEEAKDALCAITGVCGVPVQVENEWRITLSDSDTPGLSPDIHPGKTPDTSSIPHSEEYTMTEAETKALQDTVAKLSEQMADREAAEKAADEAHKVALAERDAKIAKLENEQAKRDAETASAKAEAAATVFTAKFSEAGNLRLSGVAKELARELHKRIATGANDGMNKEQASGLKLFAEGETARDLSAADLFEAFVANLPDQSRFTETATANVRGTGSTDEQRVQAVKTICDEKKLAYSDHDARKQALAIAASDARFAKLWK